MVNQVMGHHLDASFVHGIAALVLPAVAPHSSAPSRILHAFAAMTQGKKSPAAVKITGAGQLAGRAIRDGVKVGGTNP
jgi:hypothetical protein